MKRRFQWGVSLALAAQLSIACAVARGQALSTQLFVGAGNNFQAAGQFGGGGTVDSLSKTLTFTGLDGGSHPQTMTMTGDTWAAADFGVLRSRTRVSLQNLYYNAANPEYWDGTNINTAGSPDIFLSDARASFTDTFTFSGGTDPNATVQFEYTLDGTFTQSQPDIGYAFIELWYNGDGYDMSTTQNHSVITTVPLPVYWDTPIEVTTTHITDFRFDLKGGQLQTPTPYSEGGSVFSDVDFYHTARLTGITILDSGGNPITDFTLASGSGTTYPVSTQAVPEPASVGLLAGMLAVAFACKRRNRAAR